MTAMYEIWTQAYDTFGTHDYQHACSVRSLEVAEFLLDHFNSGWGTRAELRGGPGDITTYNEATVEEFKAKYVVHYDHIFERNSELGKKYAKDEERLEAMRKVPKLP